MRHLLSPIMLLALLAVVGVVLAEAAQRGHLAWALPAVAVVFVVSLTIFGLRDRSWRLALARRRWASLGHDPARAFDLFAGHPELLGCDPKVVRAAYAQLQSLASAAGEPIPLLATDNLEADLGIDDEDLGDTLKHLEAITGRKLEGWRPGPPLNVVRTAADFVRYCSAAPNS